MSLPLVGKDLSPFLPFISIIVLRAFIVSDTLFAVRNTVTGTFGMRPLLVVPCSRETIVAFYLSAPNVCDACFPRQKWFQTVAGIYGDAQRKCGHSSAMFQQKRSPISKNQFLCGKPLNKCVEKNDCGLA